MKFCKTRLILIASSKYVYGFKHNIGFDGKSICQTNFEIEILPLISKSFNKKKFSERFNSQIKLKAAAREREEKIYHYPKLH